MKVILQLEELGMTLLGIYFLILHHLGLSVWIWIPMFLLPDIGMLGYMVNTRVGAFTYNIFHHKGIAALLIIIGYYLKNEIVIATGWLLFSHSSFDRILGYGLKYGDDFKHTHLGQLPGGKRPSIQ